jgi:hypothetical protein
MVCIRLLNRIYDHVSPMVCSRDITNSAQLRGPQHRWLHPDTMQHRIDPRVPVDQHPN